MCTGTTGFEKEIESTELFRQIQPLKLPEIFSVVLTMTRNFSFMTKQTLKMPFFYLVSSDWTPEQV